MAFEQGLCYIILFHIGTINLCIDPLLETLEALELPNNTQSHHKQQHNRPQRTATQWGSRKLPLHCVCKENTQQLTFVDLQQDKTEYSIVLHCTKIITMIQETFRASDTKTQPDQVI